MMSHTRSNNQSLEGDAALPVHSFEDGAPTNDSSNDNGVDRSYQHQRLLHHCTPVPIFSVAIYLIFWVANGEMMQGVANGTLAPEPFDRPAFLSWFSYNSMLLSWIPLIWYCRKIRKCPLDEYLRFSWASASGLTYMLSCSCVMQFLLLVMNTLWIVGLRHISVAMSNAIYQVQAAVTVGLSVWCLGSRFVAAEAIGIVVSLLGVGLIVIPPLMDRPEDEETDNGVQFEGIVATLLSAVIWAVYQIAWRVISKGKPEVSRLEGLMDTAATLGVMGVCNLFLGWPVLLVVHWAGVERFELPSWSLVPALMLNALIEYSFDASLAVAIYLTSPVITAITAPLTIPISFASDHFLYGSPLQVGNYDWIGSLLVLLGVVWMELKITLPFLGRRAQTENPYVDMSERFG